MQQYKFLHGRLRMATTLTDVADLRRALKRVRVYLGYSPTQLAALIGVSRPTLIGLERNRTRSLYRPDHATISGLVAFCKLPLPGKPTRRMKGAIETLSEVVTRMATEYGRAEYYRDRDREHDRTRRHNTTHEFDTPLTSLVDLYPAPGPTPGRRTFILDDLDDHDDPTLRTPNQVECDYLLAGIRLNADPGEAEYSKLDKREALRDAFRQVRDKLNLTQRDTYAIYGISRTTLSRLETMDRSGAALPNPATCLKFAAICHREGQTEERREAGLPLDTEWHRLATILEDAATWERHHKYAPRGVNPKYRAAKGRDPANPPKTRERRVESTPCFSIHDVS